MGTEMFIVTSSVEKFVRRMSIIYQNVGHVCTCVHLHVPKTLRKHAIGVGRVKTWVTKLSDC